MSLSLTAPFSLSLHAIAHGVFQSFFPARKPARLRQEPRECTFAMPFVAAGASFACVKSPKASKTEAFVPAVASAKSAPLMPSLSHTLRVVRLVERGQTRSQVGRMVISGRMADVCAELDRLAACEAA
jgi:hypothetical protein